MDAPSPLSRVDALFTGDPPLPRVDVSAGLTRVTRLLAIALPLDGLGLLCWTTVPGAVLTIWAWLAADELMALVDADQVDEPDAGRVRTARRVAGVALGLTALSMMLQLWLLSTDFYRVIFGLIPL